jgi:hypothetical protein
MMLVADSRISPELLAHLAALVEDDAPLDWWRRKVELGELSVIAVLHEGARVGSVLWRLGEHGGRRCLVIHGAAAFHPAIDFTGTVLPQLETYARRLGCELVRLHTRRRGLVARAQAMGFGAAEFVLLKDVAA